MYFLLMLENADVFESFEKLRELDLSRNAIEYLERNFFNNLIELQRLKLSENVLESIIDDAFVGLCCIEELVLTNNRLKTINFLQSMVTLKELFLEGNGLTRIDCGIFSVLIKLERLNLDDNSIEVIESGAFDGLNNLKILNLSGNNLKKIETGTFRGLKSLSVLFLIENKISNIDYDSFKELTHLTILYLPGNELSQLSSSCFSKRQSSIGLVELCKNKFANTVGSFLDKAVLNNPNRWTMEAVKRWKSDEHILISNLDLCEIRLNQNGGFKSKWEEFLAQFPTSIIYIISQLH